jgi:hypothetical protein
MDEDNQKQGSSQTRDVRLVRSDPYWLSEFLVPVPKRFSFSLLIGKDCTRRQ